MIRFFSLLLLTPILAVARQDQVVVVGDSPATYSKINREQIEGEYKSLKKKSRVSEKELVESHARLRGLHSLNPTQTALHDAQPVVAQQTTNDGPRRLHVSTPTVVVYERVFNNQIKVEIKDLGYGLLEQDKNYLRSLLDRLPASHLKGLHAISYELAIPSEGIEANKGALRVTGKRTADEEGRLHMQLDTEVVIGMHVYQTLSEVQKAEWRSIIGKAGYPNNLLDSEVIFGSAYSRYLENSHYMLQNDATFERYLPMSLFVASTFISPNTPVIYGYQTSRDNGRVEQTLGRAVKSAFADNPSSPLDQSEAIHLGKFVLHVKQGKVIAWSERQTAQDERKYVNGMPVLQADLALIHMMKTSVDAPQALLNRFK